MEGNTNDAPSATEWECSPKEERQAGAKKEGITTAEYAGQKLFFG